ncbi:Platelet-derived growth factor receptor alpha [Orchesella cincta]|uniref:Platelet-derived growth factor receptor alpha n=1 Tax=Orchesella cincta TaxID=48709 RepID=A0A1D2MEM3_ORCCI|nr:Platelet-derived growth factor receptor alpha [Orchesella cincta]
MNPETLLGSGAFGVVCQGYVQKVKGEAGIQVAVKTTNSSSPSTALTGILSEIKVMNYLGKHENIVNIIGAYTKRIKKGKIYLFLELCSLGSLEKYLRKNISGLERQHGTHTDRKTAVANYYKRFDNKMENSPVEPVEPATYRSSEPFGIKSEIESLKVDNSGSADLYRWSYEIASGMDFLASKNGFLGLQTLVLNLLKVYNYHSPAIAIVKFICLFC